ncbi:hypothetical protein FQN49_006285 [Arthroderma sp. PD_2]|nr:hypothetical protein FQN49_006285 [Arthroderma sp. PD_2]
MAAIKPPDFEIMDQHHYAREQQGEQDGFDVYDDEQDAEGELFDEQQYDEPSALDDDLAAEMEAELAAHADASSAPASATADVSHTGDTGHEAEVEDEVEIGTPRSQPHTTVESSEDESGMSTAEDANQSMDEDALEQQRQLQEQLEVIAELEAQVQAETLRWEQMGNPILKSKLGKRVQNLRQALELKKVSIGGGSFLHSNTHPSLPQSGSTARHGLRAALKKHKRLSPSQQASHLPHVLIALNEYIPYLFEISRGLSSSSWRGDEGGQDEEAEKKWNDVEEIDILLRSEIEVEWRPTLSSMSTLRFLRQSAMRGHDSSSLSSSSSRVKGRGLDFEIAFVLSTLAYVLSSLARVKYLTILYSAATPTVEQKVAAVLTATKNLLQVSSIHSYLATFSPASISPPSNTYAPGDSGAKLVQIPVPDLDPSTQSALSSLALAEATLLAVLKDDAYLSACIQSRNKHDTEWMVKAPDIPKVRTLLFARLCVRAAEYAEQAAASVGMVQKGSASAPSSGDSTMERKVDDDLVNYMSILARVSRAKACRFFGIDAEMAGKVGEGIAWLRAARAVLGFKGSTAETEAEKSAKGRLGGFSRLKKEWSERREEKKIEKEATSSKAGELETDIDYGDDAGRDEEGRVIDMLEKKWVKMNDTINTQLIPSSASYISNLPSGRDIHAPPAPYVPPRLEPGQLERLRAPLDPTDDHAEVESSEDDDEKEGRRSYY